MDFSWAAFGCAAMLRLIKDHMKKVLRKLSIMVLSTLLLAHSALAVAANKPLSKEVYTQQGFDTRYNDDFAKWKKVFLKELNEVMDAIREDEKYGKSLLAPENAPLLAQTFKTSVELSSKGIFLRKLLIEGYYESTRDVAADGTTFARLIRNDKTRVIGYGGHLAIDEKDAEILYMQFSDFSTMTEDDFKESFIMSAFEAPSLPRYKTATRNAWPALVFRRNENKQLVMIGLSSEMARILERISYAQLM